jgi:hypothetical protein
MRWRVRLFPMLAAGMMSCAIFCVRAHADEIRLKDGSKIIGTIVGYEDDSFRVQTAYGFALIRKNSVKEIVPTDAPKPADGAVAPSDTVATKPEAKPADSAATTAQAKSVTNGTVTTEPVTNPAATPIKPPMTAPAALPVITPVSASPAAKAADATKLSSSPVPPPPPPPVVVQESVLGNLYTNQTYGFSMYRPPDWGIMADSRSAMPQAIAALGNSDHSSLLVIGRDTDGGSLDARAASTEHKLREIYGDYRPTPSRHISVAGLPAVEQGFTGNADGHDWSVTAVTLVRGEEVFTILGMTYEESDLIQFQENVISKVVGSLQFAVPPQN